MMKYTAVILSVFLASPAFAGPGAGGVHSQDSSNLTRYEQRMQEQEQQTLSEIEAEKMGHYSPSSGAYFIDVPVAAAKQEKNESQAPVKQGVQH